MDRPSLAQKLRDLRVGAGLSQQVLGARLGRAQSYISKIENAERRVEMLEIDQWADACGKVMFWTFVGKQQAADIDGTDGPVRSGEVQHSSAADSDVVAALAWLLPRLKPSERTLLQNTLTYLMSKASERQG